MKILLIALDFRIKRMPLSLGYLKSYADKYTSHDIVIKNYLVDQDIEEVFDEIISYKPDVVGFSAYVWNIDLVKVLSELLKQQGVKIVWGGPEACELPYVDFVIQGEGEDAFLQLINNGFSENVVGKSIDLDEVPSPEFPEVYETAYVQSSRGCNSGCYYCFECSTSARYFPVDIVVDQLTKFIKQGYKEIWLIESMFGSDRERAVKICKEVALANKDAKIIIETNVELLDKELVSLMLEANMTNVNIGIQSIHDDVLKNVNRRINLEKVKENITLLKSNGFRIVADLIIGLPGDNFSKFKESVEFLADLKVDVISALPLQVLPGTKLLEFVEQFQIKYNPEPPYEVVSNYSFSEDQMHKTLHYYKEFAKNYEFHKGEQILL